MFESVDGRTPARVPYYKLTVSLLLWWAKNEGDRAVTTLFIYFKMLKGGANSKIGDGILTKFKLIQALIVVLYARMKKIHSKLKALEWSQHFSHYKSMGTFPNAQGQVTHKSLVGSRRISNPSEILWVYLLPARMKKIQSKMKDLEWSQHYSLIFLTLNCSLLLSQ